MNKLKSIYSSAYSAAITILVVTAVTIGAELSASFKNWLVTLSGHHWVTKSYLSLIAFALFYALFFLTRKSVSERTAKKALAVLEIFTILGFAAILGFYLYEFFVQ